MTIIPLDVTWFPKLFEVYLLRWLETKHVELQKLTDEDIKDIGLEPPRRDFDTVKPFWMP